MKRKEESKAKLVVPINYTYILHIDPGLKTREPALHINDPSERHAMS